MTPVPLPDIILSKLEREHRGIEHAILLDDLLDWLLERGHIEKIDEHTERRIRAIIAKNVKICNAGEGYYLARERGHKEDVEEAIRYINRTYKIPIENKIEEKRRAFLQYYPELDDRQMRLF